MDVATWTTISRLLDEALDLPADARAAWLERLPREYDAVKPRLRALLTDASSMGRAAFLATLPKFAAADATGHGAAPATRDGASVGPYRLVRLLASGGQGSVWLAERADGLMARAVAVKLPHGLAFRPGLAERMAREREILAGLEHPHIARLYDAGLTAAGEPYLALEYVDGVPLDRHADAQRLDTAARVRLFQQVIAAVAFAHGRLVIHRDLKPSNILVTSDGEVRLLDFGIAKLLDADAPDSTLTRESGRAMTPAYASPEQIAQQPLGVASDVYSLSVVLYELLTGVRPYAVARDSVAALEEAVLTQEPRRASDTASGPARRALAGDLDTILAKALKKDPAARYETAAAFGDDLARWLDGRPVLARPDSVAYRLRKFVARHRVGAAAAAASIVAVLSGAGLAIWQAQVARAERDVAVQQRARALASSGFLQSLLQQAGDTPLTATQLLDRGTAQLATSTDLDPGVLAFLQYEISTHYLRFNQTDREVALLTASAESARRAGDLEIVALAQCAGAWALAQRDLAEARRRLDDGQAVLAQLAAPGYRVRAECVRAEARTLALAGRRAEALALLEAASRWPLDGDADWSRRGLLRGLMADLYLQANRPADALALYETGLDEIRAHGQAGTLNEFVGLNNLAVALSRAGEHQAAGAIYDDLLTRVEKGAFPVAPLGLLNSAGLEVLRLGGAARALALADREHAASSGAGNRLLAAIADMLAARAHLAERQLADADRRLDRAEQAFGANPRGFAPMLAQAGLVRAEILAARGQLEAATARVREVLDRQGYPQGPPQANVDRALRLLAAFRLQAGDASGAHEAAAASLEIATRSARSALRSGEVGESALLVARALRAMGRTSEAAAAAALAVEGLTHGLGEGHVLTGDARALRVAVEAY